MLIALARTKKPGAFSGQSDDTSHKKADLGQAQDRHAVSWVSISRMVWFADPRQVL
jgi:hypothetical protein